jgi:membrane fusion protein (multidrug efflux system)
MIGRTLVIAAVLIVIALTATLYWLYARNFETTDDAFIDGNSVLISPRVSGTVLKVHFADNQPVREGDLLVEIDPRDFENRVASARAALEQARAQEAAAQADLALTRITSGAVVDQAAGALATARANLVQARAEAERAHADVLRYRTLHEKDEVSKQQLDVAEAAARSTDAQVQAAEAQVSQAQARLAEARSAPQQVDVKQSQLQTAGATIGQAEATLRQAELDLSYTRLYAPHDGRIVRKSIVVGALVQAGQTLTAIVYGDPWVTANFKETQLTRMRPGQPVTIEVDAYPDRDFRGHVDSIQSGTGSHFSLLPPENATGNFVKVVQRVPVKIVFDEKPDPQHLLALGMSVIPKVRVDSEPGAAGKQAPEQATNP